MDNAYEWDQPRNTFDVSAFANEYMEPANTPERYTDPGKAIEAWFRLSGKHPTCVMITGYIEQEKALRTWAVENEQVFREWADKYHCPYKTDYLLNACRKPVRKTEDSHSDQLYPFCLG